jgi:GntR family transcriptional regulator
MAETGGRNGMTASGAPRANVPRSTPKYHRLEADLRRRMSAGEYAVGSVLPPEHELSRMYGVSRHTVRAALGRMQADRLIERGAGRGTFVLPQHDRVRFYLDRSFTQQMAELGLVASSRVLQAETGVITEDDPDPLRRQQGASCFRLTRIRMGGSEPIGVQRTTVLTRRCPDFETHDFARESVYEVLARHYQLMAKEIHHSVGAAIANAREAKLLGTRRGDPLLLVNTTALLEGGEILEYTASRYRADRYEYSTRHVFGAESSRGFA